MSDEGPNPLPGKGFPGWLGRQVGHVRRAWRTRVGERVVYRQEHVQEAPLPGQPGVTLRRVVRDEVIVTPPRSPAPSSPPSSPQPPSDAAGR